jgi:two-component sensor histidine kinase
MRPTRQHDRSPNQRSPALAPEIEPGIENNTLRLECPNTGREIHSGVIHRNARLISIRARCPICEGVHDWPVAGESLGTGWFADHRAKRARLTKAQDAPQRSLEPSQEIVELRDQLLDELNHRHKNNLQMLYDLLQTACSKTDNAEAREVLSDTSRRIGAMGTAQQVFYSVRDATDVSGQQFLKAICDNAKIFLGKNVSINADAVTGSVPKETAVPLALILNELITNAAKYAPDDRGQVAIDVGLSQRSGSHELSVQDHGPGFNFKEAKARASGLGLVTKLARRLKGTFTVERGAGARCTLRFPDQ